MICLGSNLYMVIRSAPFPDGPVPSHPAPSELYPLFRRHRPLGEGCKLFMRPEDNAAPFGMVSGAAIAASVLSASGISCRILPERSAPLASFRGRKVILFGDSLTSEAAARELGHAVFQITYQKACDPGATGPNRILCVPPIAGEA
jgi:hypothetical protein